MAQAHTRYARGLEASNTSRLQQLVLVPYNRRNGNTKGPDAGSFTLQLLYALWAVITGALSIPAAIYLLFPPKSKKTFGLGRGGRHCSSAAQRTGGIRFSPYPRRRLEGNQREIDRLGDRQATSKVVAFAPQCTHLGCAYSYDAQEQRILVSVPYIDLCPGREGADGPCATCA